MKNYVLIHPWRVVPLEEMLMLMEILKDVPAAREAFTQERDPATIH